MMPSRIASAWGSGEMVCLKSVPRPGRREIVVLCTQLKQLSNLMTPPELRSTGTSPDGGLHGVTMLIRFRPAWSAQSSDEYFSTWQPGTGWPVTGEMPEPSDLQCHEEGTQPYKCLLMRRRPSFTGENHQSRPATTNSLHLILVISRRQSSPVSRVRLPKPDSRALAEKLRSPKYPL